MCNGIKKNINQEVKEYKSNVGKGYDLRPIVESELRGHISETIKGLETTKNNTTYTAITAVVFDNNTNNFHIFPEDDEIYNELVDKFTDLRNHIYKKLKNTEIQVTGGGSGSNFTRYTNIKKVLNPSYENTVNNLYRYIEVKSPEAIYRLNFMRYTCSAEGVVGCTMRAIQFHKIVNGKGVNGPKNSFDICYPKTDNTLDSCFSDKNKNICYNPPIEWPTTWSDETIDKIIDCFKDFIEKEGNI